MYYKTVVELICEIVYILHLSKVGMRYLAIKKFCDLLLQDPFFADKFNNKELLKPNC
jgi:hypothetical protein